MAAACRTAARGASLSRRKPTEPAWLTREGSEKEGVDKDENREKRASSLEEEVDKDENREEMERIRKERRRTREGKSGPQSPPPLFHSSNSKYHAGAPSLVPPALPHRVAVAGAISDAPPPLNRRSRSGYGPLEKVKDLTN
uniref:Uncharacterized protein n=1 Tax=Oryza glumipatula TaxID=40148 RepID=A0A0E0ARD3_9ORYZ